MDLDTNRILAHPLTAGLGGALVALRFAPGLSWIERLANVIAGAMCAGYLAPAAMEVLTLSSLSAEAALSFVIGMFGMSIAAAVIEAVRAVDWARIVTGWLGRKD